MENNHRLTLDAEKDAKIADLKAEITRLRGALKNLLLECDITDCGGKDCDQLDCLAVRTAQRALEGEG